MLFQKLKLPKVQMSLALIAIYLSAFGQLPFEQYLYVLVVSLGSTMLFDLVLSYARTRKLFIPHAAMVTGMILTLLVDPSLPWYKITTIAFIAMAAKNFVRINNKHIFNPAATGLLAGNFIFGSNIAWWGSSFHYSNTFSIQTLILYIILLSPLYISAYRMRKYYSILSFLAIYTAITIFSFGNLSINTLFIAVLNPTLLFFSSVMLPEPLTSPHERNKQLLFGFSVAALNFILILNIVAGNIFIPDPLIVSLLIANIIFFKK